MFSFARFDNERVRLDVVAPSKRMQFTTARARLNPSKQIFGPERFIQIAKNMTMPQDDDMISPDLLLAGAEVTSCPGRVYVSPELVRFPVSENGERQCKLFGLQRLKAIITGT